MRDIEKLCVTSNMGQIDSSLINYSKMLSFSFSNTINIINFLHFQPHYNLPTSILHNFPVLQKNSLVEETKEMVKGIYGYKYKNVFFSFLNDNTIQSLLNFEKSFNPDLYLFGMKKNESIFDLYILSFIQKTQKNTLFIPEGISTNISNILVPIDFSEISYEALKTGHYFSEKHQANLEALYIYDVPSSYHLTGKSYTEFTQLIRIEIQEKFSIIEQKLGAKIKLSIQINNTKSISHKIITYAKENKKDFMVIGHNNGFWGTITEELLVQIPQIPFFIVKNQNMYVKV